MFCWSCMSYGDRSGKTKLSISGVKYYLLYLRNFDMNRSIHDYTTRG